MNNDLKTLGSFSFIIHQIAAGADALGTILVLIALSWGGCVLYFQHRNLPHKA